MKNETRNNLSQWSLIDSNYDRIKKIYIFSIFKKINILIFKRKKEIE